MTSYCSCLLFEYLRQLALDLCTGRSRLLGRERGRRVDEWCFTIHCVVVELLTLGCATGHRLEFRHSTKFPSYPFSFLQAISECGLKTALFFFCVFVFPFRTGWQNVLHCRRTGRYSSTAFFAALHTSQVVMEIVT